MLRIDRNSDQSPRLARFQLPEKAVVGLFLRRRPLYPAELRDHVLESLIFSGFRGFGDVHRELWGGFANQEGRLLIGFSNSDGRTSSHLLILISGSSASE